MSNVSTETLQPLEPFPAGEPLTPAPKLPPTPNDPPWKPGIAVGMWFLSVVLVVLVPGIFLAPYALSVAADHPDREALMAALTTDPIAIGLQIAATIPAHLITLFFAWMVVTNGRKFPFFQTLGWKSGGMKWWHYVAILAGFFVLAAAVSTVLPEQENEMLRILKSSRYAVFLVAFMATVTAPFVEEVIYRGILYSALQRSVGVGWAVALVTMLFSVVHLPQYYPSWSTMLLLTVLSLALTLIRVKTDNLLPCVIFHTIFNASQSLLLILEPYLPKEAPAAIPESASAIFHLIK